MREYCLGVHPKKASVASSTNKGEDYKKPVWLWPPTTLDKDQTQTIKVSGVNRIRFVFSVPLRLTGREKKRFISTEDVADSGVPKTALGALIERDKLGILETHTLLSGGRSISQHGLSSLWETEFLASKKFNAF